MKIQLITLLIALLAISTTAQVSKTVNCTPGSLKTLLTTNEQAVVTNLIIKGSVDARDFKTMRDDMPVLAELDLSGVTIVAYKGNEGTSNSRKGSNYRGRCLLELQH